MALTNPACRSQYTANGTTTAFSTGFVFLLNSQVTVTLTDLSGNVTTLNQGTDYTVSGGPVSSSGALVPGVGTVTCAVAPTSGYAVTVTRVTPLTQQTTFVPNDELPASSFENGLDLLTMMEQEQNSAGGSVDRAIKYSPQEPPGYLSTLPLPAVRAGKQLGFDTSGNFLLYTDIGQPRGNWITGTAYNYRDLITDPVTGNIYIALLAYTSGASIAADLAAGDLGLILNVGAASAPAAASATAAAASATAAATSATSAATSATGAAGSATSAASSASNSAASAASAASSAATATMGFVRGYLSGALITNDTTTPNTVIDVSTGAAGSDDFTTLMSLVSAVKKSISSTWAVGSGNGGLDTGTVAASTWYHVYVIERTDTQVVDVLISASSSSPTMPTSYTKKRRIGSILTDASSQIVPFSQNGDEFLWLTPVQDINSGSLPSDTATLYTLTVPSGVKVNALVDGSFYSAGTATILFTPPDVDSVASAVNGLMTGQQVNGGNTTINLNMRTNTASQLRLYVNSAGTAGYFTTRGWVDTRGRFN